MLCSALRIAASHTSGGAFIEDYFTDEEYGGLDRTSIRASLKLDPAPGITNTTVIQYTDEDGTNTPYLLWSAYSCGATNNGIPLITGAGCLLTKATNPGFAAFQAHEAHSLPVAAQAEAPVADAVGVDGVGGHGAANSADW